MRQESISTLKARRDTKLRELAGIGPFISGSVASVKVRCGNLGCRCAAGDRHDATILCKKVSGKSTSLHIPLELVGEVREWSKANKRLKQLCKEITALGERIIRLHVKTTRATARNRSRVSKTSPG